MVTDFDEFSALVTAPLARLKIKKLVKDMETLMLFVCYLNPEPKR